MPDPEALTAALIQLSEHAERLSALDSRQAAADGETRQRLDVLSALAAAVKRTLTDQAVILSGLTDRLERLDPADGQETILYTPSASPRFWQLSGADREETIAKLRGWVDQIYRPGYGQLAGALGPCWEQHPLCLYTLDWLSELWSVLYLQPTRTAGTLAGQAEWQTRILAAAADQMARETSRCAHTASRRPLPGTASQLP